MCLSLSLFPLLSVQGVHFNFYFLYLSVVHFKPSKMYKHIQMFLWDSPALHQFVRIWHFAEAKQEWESETHCHARRLEISNVRQLNSNPEMVNELGCQIWVFNKHIASMDNYSMNEKCSLQKNYLTIVCLWKKPRTSGFLKVRGKSRSVAFIQVCWSAILILIFLVISRFSVIPWNSLLCSLHKPDLYLQKYITSKQNMPRQHTFYIGPENTEM